MIRVEGKVKVIVKRQPTEEGGECPCPFTCSSCSLPPTYSSGSHTLPSHLHAILVCDKALVNRRDLYKLVSNILQRLLSIARVRPGKKTRVRVKRIRVRVRHKLVSAALQ